MGAIPWLEIGVQGADIIGNQLQAKQQFERTKKLMEIQQANQQELNLQGQAIQLDTWEKTNFPAQISMLKKAGLNPSLMYAKGGAGGTTGGQGGGSASMGNASMAQPMGIANIMAMKQQSAQIELLNAEASLKKAEEEKLRGVDTAKAQSEIEKIIAETKNEAIKGELMELQKQYEAIKVANEQSIIDASLTKIAEETRSLVNQNKITEATMLAIIKQANAEAIGAELANELTKAQTNLSKEQIEKIRTELYNDWTRIQNEIYALDQKDQQIAIDKFVAEFNARYVGTGKVLGKILKNASDYLDHVGPTVGKVYKDEVKIPYRR